MESLSSARFEKIVILANSLYEETLKHLQGPKVEFIIKEDLGMENIKDYIEMNSSSMPPKTVWMTLIGCFSVSKLEDCSLCEQAFCPNPLKTIVSYPNADNIEKCSSLIWKICNTCLVLIEDMKSVLSPEAAFFLIPPYPIFIYVKDEISHANLHKQQPDLPSVTAAKDEVALWRHLLTQLSRESLAICCETLRELNCSQRPITEYRKFLPESHVQIIDNESSNPSITYFSYWKTALLEVFDEMVCGKFIQDPSPFSEFSGNEESSTYQLDDTIIPSKMEDNYKLDTGDSLGIPSLEIKDEISDTVSDKSADINLGSLSQVSHLSKKEITKSDEMLHITIIPKEKEPSFEKEKSICQVKQDETKLTESVKNEYEEYKDENFVKDVSRTNQNESNFKSIKDDDIKSIEDNELKVDKDDDKSVMSNLSSDGFSISESGDEAPLKEPEYFTEKEVGLYEQLVFICLTDTTDFLPFSDIKPSCFLVWDLASLINSCFETYISNYDPAIFKKKSLIIIASDFRLIGTDLTVPMCKSMVCPKALSYFSITEASRSDLIKEKIELAKILKEKLESQFSESSKVVFAPVLPRMCVAAPDEWAIKVHNQLTSCLLLRNPRPFVSILEGSKYKWEKVFAEFKIKWEDELELQLDDVDIQIKNVIEKYLEFTVPIFTWVELPVPNGQMHPGIEADLRRFLRILIETAIPSLKSLFENLEETQPPTGFPQCPPPYRAWRPNQPFSLGGFRNAVPRMRGQPFFRHPWQARMRPFGPPMNFQPSRFRGNAPCPPPMVPGPKTKMLKMNSLPTADKGIYRAGDKESSNLQEEYSSSSDDDNEKDEYPNDEGVFSPNLDKLLLSTHSKSYKKIFVVGKHFLVDCLENTQTRAVPLTEDLSCMTYHDIPQLLGKMGNFMPQEGICVLAFDLSSFTTTLKKSPNCRKFGCLPAITIEDLRTQSGNPMSGASQSISSRFEEIEEFVLKLSKYIYVVVLPIFPSKVFCDDSPLRSVHFISHCLVGLESSFTVTGNADEWKDNLNLISSLWTEFYERINYDKPDVLCLIKEYLIDTKDTLKLENEPLISRKNKVTVSSWKRLVKIILQLLGDSLSTSHPNQKDLKSNTEKKHDIVVKDGTQVKDDGKKKSGKITNLTYSIPRDFLPKFLKTLDSSAEWDIYEDLCSFTVKAASTAFIVNKLHNLRIADTKLKVHIDGEAEEDFDIRYVLDKASQKYVKSIFDNIFYPRINLQILENIKKVYCGEPKFAKFKTQPCVLNCSEREAEDCFFYHDGFDMRRPLDAIFYGPVMCNLPKDYNNHCHHGFYCTFSHTEFEQLFHPSNIQVEECPDGEKANCSKSVCHMAHLNSPEMFFVDGWRDLVVYGEHHSINFLVGGIRAITKVSPEANPRICLMSLSSSFLQMVQGVIQDVLIAYNISSVNLIDVKPSNIYMFNVFLGTPHAFQNCPHVILSPHVPGVLIVDGISEILDNDVKSNTLLEVCQKFGITDRKSAVNKVFVGNSDAKNIAQSVAKQLGIAITEVEKEEKPIFTEKRCKNTATSRKPAYHGSKKMKRHPYDSAPPPRPGNKRGLSPHRRETRSPIPEHPKRRKSEGKSPMDRRDQRKEKMLSSHRKPPPKTDKAKSRSRNRPSSSSTSSSSSSSSSESSEKELREESEVSFANLRQKIGEELYLKYLDSEKEMKDLLDDEYSVFKSFPNMHPDYNTYYEDFLTKYERKYPKKKHSQHREELWKNCWNSNIQKIKLRAFQKKKNRLIKIYMEKSKEREQIYMEKSKEREQVSFPPPPPPSSSFRSSSLALGNPTSSGNEHLQNTSRTASSSVDTTQSSSSLYYSGSSNVTDPFCGLYPKVAHASSDGQYADVTSKSRYTSSNTSYEGLKGTSSLQHTSSDNHSGQYTPLDSSSSRPHGSGNTYKPLDSISVVPSVSSSVFPIQSSSSSSALSSPLESIFKAINLPVRSMNTTTSISDTTSSPSLTDYLSHLNSCKPSGNPSFDVRVSNSTSNITSSDSTYLSSFLKSTESNSSSGIVSAKDEASLGRSKSTKFTVDGALTLLEKLSDKLGVIGPAILAMIKNSRDAGVLSNKGLAVFTDEDNIFLIKVVLDKLKNIQKTGPKVLIPAVTQAQDWTKQLLKYAQESQNKEIDQSDLERIAKATLGKDSIFVLKMIRETATEKGLRLSDKEMNDTYLKICSIHFDIEMGVTKKMRHT